MRYFAYGSNLDWSQMKSRCPSATCIGIARLPDYRLAFTRKSVKRGCGVADVVRSAGHSVWGVVFDISAPHVATLDQSEGYREGRQRNSYWRRKCVVLLDGDKKRPVAVETYFAEAEANPPLPNQAYKDLIVSGARHWRLPDDYLAQLEAVKVSG
jgi:gamma-glutamylcyclotransferase (GGCT)/AIG2-like uncharacterized protein YtfP